MDDPSAIYEPSPPPGSSYQSPTPGVWPWFVTYCIVMAVFCACGCALGVVFLVVDPQELEMEAVEAKIIGVVYMLVSSLLFIPFILGPFLPRRKWVWIYDIVLICLGMTSCCTLPACIALIIFWIKPETRQFFGWT